MPGVRTEVTEIATALGMLAPSLADAVADRPDRLLNVSDHVWDRLVATYRADEDHDLFEAAFANGAAFLTADDGLRNRAPKLVEWKGPHQPPGDDVIPADIRVDHVFQISCKYLSKIMLNCGPARIFDRLLVGEERSGANWFEVIAPAEYQEFYESARLHADGDLPTAVSDLTAIDRGLLKKALKSRKLPFNVRPGWDVLCASVATASAARWAANLKDDRTKLRLLWRLLRIGDASYFVLGTDGTSHVRLRVASAWDWMQTFELRSLSVHPRAAGQAEVGWRAHVRVLNTGAEMDVNGHVEIRWSHGRFQGAPEAKVYLDTAHAEVPGYFLLV
jgi:hypothetical protein